MPQATAVIWGDSYLTYDQLDERANQLAHHLQTLGVQPEKRVAICLSRSLELVIAMLAVLKAGGAYIPIDPTYPKDRRQLMLESSHPMILITEQSFSDDLNFNGESFYIDTDWPPPKSKVLPSI